MNAPRTMTILVIAVMLAGLSYVAWMSRQVASAAAGASGSEARTSKVDQAIQETERYMAGRSR